MKKVITAFETPEVQVQLSNINLDVSKRRFKLTLGTKTSKQRKFHEEEVEGFITNELQAYMTVMKLVKVPVDHDGEVVWIPSGEKATNFQKFCMKHDLPIGPGTLVTLSFTCDNTSPEYHLNPFRLIKLKDRNILTLVNVPSKSKQDILQGDGTVKTIYSVKRGKVEGRSVRAFVRRDKYRRLITQVSRTVEVLSAEQVAAAQ